MTNPLLNKIANTLRSGPRTVSELTERCRVCDTAVRKHLKTLHGLKAIHVSDYRKTKARTEAVYRWGEGEDADMPYGVAKRITSDAAVLPAPVPLGAWGCVW